MRKSDTGLSAKSVRMSRVAIFGAAMAVIWLSVGEFTDVVLTAAWVSGVTSLVMLIAQFYDFRFKRSGDDVFEGDKPDG